MIKAHQQRWGLSSFSSNCYLCFNPFLVNTHTSLFRHSSNYARCLGFKWLMQEVPGYLKELLVLLHSVANHWLASKEAGIKNHGSLLARTSMMSNRPRGLPEELCRSVHLVLFSLKKGIWSSAKRIDPQKSMLHGFKALMWVHFTDCKTWDMLYLHLHPSQSEVQVLNFKIAFLHGNGIFLIFSFIGIFVWFPSTGWLQDHSLICILLLSTQNRFVEVHRISCWSRVYFSPLVW